MWKATDAGGALLTLLFFGQSGRSGGAAGPQGASEERVRHEGVQPHPGGTGGREVDCGGGREAGRGERSRGRRGGRGGGLRREEVGRRCVLFVCVRELGAGNGPLAR